MSLWPLHYEDIFEENYDIGQNQLRNSLNIYFLLAKNKLFRLLKSGNEIIVNDWWSNCSSSHFGFGYKSFYTRSYIRNDYWSSRYVRRIYVYLLYTGLDLCIYPWINMLQNVIQSLRKNRNQKCATFQA